MKKRIICIIAGIMMLLSGVANAATYTLPEKMQNQLAIGSGLKGSFTVTADGELSKTPFLNAFCDATYDLRGMSSGHDLHYYLFQENNGSQTIIAELYKKDGQYYLRSDIVQGKILELSGFSIFLLHDISLCRKIMQPHFQFVLIFVDFGFPLFFLYILRQGEVVHECGRNGRILTLLRKQRIKENGKT